MPIVPKGVVIGVKPLFAEGEIGVEPVFEFGDPALGSIHPSGDVLLGKPGAQALADEVRDDFGPPAGGADARGG